VTAAAARMLLVAHGSDGDVLPFVRLGRVLRERGHEVTLLTHAPYRRRVEAAGLEYVPIDSPEDFARYSADTALLPGGRGTLDWLDFYRRNHLFDQLERECRALAARAVPGRTVLVGRHTSALSALMVRDLLGVPAAWVAVAPIQQLAAGVARHLHQHVLAPGIDEVRLRLGLPPVRDWPAWFHSADLHLGLWPRWFDVAGPASGTSLHLTGFPLPDDDLTPPSARAPERPPPPGPSPRRPGRADGPGRGGTAGSAADPSDAEVPAPLSGSPLAEADTPRTEPLPAEPAAPPLALARGTVLVTGGTGRMVHPGFYAAAVAGCRRAGLPVLLVTPHVELVPRPLPPGVAWFPRLPFRTVMPEVGVVLHHGGIGTLTRALAAGTPQVILAHGADRPDNAARLAKEGLARWLPETRWTADEVAGALRAALRDGRRPPRTGPEDAANGLAVAAEHLESLLHRSPPAAPSPPHRQDTPAPPAERLADLPADQRRLLAARLRRRLADRGAP
jgi:rhamnosyltransferase subunit B